MKTALKLSLLALIGAAPLALIANTASAAIVCNEAGDCWHVHRDYSYPPEAHIIIHPDNWRWHSGDHYVWREHQGRGYWHDGEWKDF